MIRELSGKKFILGVTASIAAYKSAELIRLLREAGAEIRVVMSQSANVFITPMTLQSLSGNQVFQSLLDVDSEATMSHISLARWADMILVAPATANFIAKMTHGFADDLLTAICLATTAPITISPAMNVMMWSNTITQSNIQKLKNRNIKILGPEAGIQACGELGEGRMMEPENIVYQLIQSFQKSQRLQGKKIVITAGPTREAIDPVRYISNHSSGKMGYAIAEAALTEGAEVVLISGPTALSTSSLIKKIDVRTAEEMFHAVMQQMADCDIFISTAAVSDYRVKNISQEKIKKSKDVMILECVRNPDILSAVSALAKRPLIMGFAAETENLLENAKNKLVNKNLDFIVGNLVGDNKGFCADFNELIVLTPGSDEVRKLSFASKSVLAVQLVEIMIDYVMDNGVNNKG